MAFQAYLVEGLARWNMQRSEDSVEHVEGKLRSFDVSLKHRLNSISSAVRGEPFLSSFSTPPAYTVEIIGVEYLRFQSGDFPIVEDLNKDIDEAFQDDIGIESDIEDVGDIEEDETITLPEESSDSGAEVISQGFTY